MFVIVRGPSGGPPTTAVEANRDQNNEESLVVVCVWGDLCQEVLLAPDGVVKPLAQQCVELLQDQTGALHLPGALPPAAV